MTKPSILLPIVAAAAGLGALVVSTGDAHAQRRKSTLADQPAVRHRLLLVK